MITPTIASAVGIPSKPEPKVAPENKAAPQKPVVEDKAAAGENLGTKEDSGTKENSGTKEDSAASKEPAPEAKTSATPEAPPRPFIQLDELLDDDLENRGLLIEDLAPVDPVAAERWRQWRERLEADGINARLPRRRAETVFARLQRVAEDLKINEALIESKIARIEQDISVLKAIGATIEPIQRRLANARRALRKEPPNLENIAKVLSQLESDVLHETERAEPIGTTPAPTSTSSP
ncbi:MAG: hypothetical protein AAF449_12955 [Myxococcota bacterium]